MINEIIYPKQTTYDGVSVNTTSTFVNYGGYFKSDGSLFVIGYYQGTFGSFSFQEFGTYSLINGG